MGGENIRQQEVQIHWEMDHQGRCGGKAAQPVSLEIKMGGKLTDPDEAFVGLLEIESGTQCQKFGMIPEIRTAQQDLRENANSPVVVFVRIGARRSNL